MSNRILSLLSKRECGLKLTDANIARITLHHGGELARWLEGKQAQGQDDTAGRASIPRQARNRVAERQPERRTIEQAMEILGLPKRTIQEKAQRNEIPGAVKIFGRWTFDLVQLRNFVRNRQCENQKPRPEPIGVTTSSGAKRRLRVNSTDGLYTRTIQKLRKIS